MFAHATVLSCERGARPGKSRHGTEVRLSRDTRARANNKRENVWHHSEFRDLDLYDLNRF